MYCPQCGNNNVTIQIVTETKLKQKRHGLLYWLLIGWWLQPLLWIFLTLPMLILTIFKPKKYKAVNHSRKIAVCQSCGNSWNIN